MNKLTHFDRPFRIWIPQILGINACKKLSILDLGAGDGMLGRTLSDFASRQGWDWSFTNVDLNLPPLGGLASTSAEWVKASVVKLPFADNSFDLAIATTMTHHLESDTEVIDHFREAGRVSRQAILIGDMVRSPLFMAILWAALLTIRAPRKFRHDGVQSVKRGWKKPEWERLATLAGLNGSRVWVENGVRIFLEYRTKDNST
jgi:SAM-dependent methyltransferase